jgi:hypothetical protein
MQSANVTSTLDAKKIKVNNETDVMVLILDESERLNKKIRMTKEYPKKLSAYDIIAVLCECDSNRAAEKYRDLIKIDVNGKTVDVQFEGRGQKPTPVLTPIQIINLINLLPNKYPLVQFFKQISAQITVRYIGGDVSLANEVVQIDQKFRDGSIPANHPAQAFRDEAKTISDHALNDLKIRAEISKLEQEVNEMRVRTLKQGLELFALYPPIDERAKIVEADQVSQIKRLLVNALSVVVQNSPPSIENSAQPIQTPKREVTFEMVAKECNLNLTPQELRKKSSQIGKKVAKLYREKYEKEPVKHTQLTNGHSITTNTYFEEDIDLIEQALRDVFDLDESESEMTPEPSDSRSILSYFGK